MARSRAEVFAIDGTIPAVYSASGPSVWDRRRWVGALKGYRRIEPIRREVQGHPVTFRASVVVSIRRPSGESTLRGPLTLIVRGGFLEISHPIRPVAVFFGQEFYFRATDLRIETYRDETYRDQRERIRVTDTSYGTDASLSVTALPRFYQTDLGGIWQRGGGDGRQAAAPRSS
jgi:hypothetical protein